MVGGDPPFTSFMWSDTTAVNTRSVYHWLKKEKSDPDNLSLCPILDLANHHFSDERATTALPLPIFRSPENIPLSKGDELFGTYEGNERILCQSASMGCK